MKTIGMQRHQTIESLTSQHVVQGTQAQIILWEQMSVQIILIVGEDGFHSLFARSVFLIHSKFPWITSDTWTAPFDHRFAVLKTNLQTQTATVAVEANCALLVTLTDILASLIGEPLTASILGSAWGHPAQISADKDKKDES